MTYYLLCAFLLLANAEPDARPSGGTHALRHSFKAPFIKGAQKPFWRAGAGAYIEEDYVRVTPAKQSRTGFMWNLVPSTMVDWQVDIEFQCTGHKNYGGDGFAFWYAEQKAMLGSVFGSADYWNGLGIFFDTYNNDNQGASSTVLAIENDGTQAYNPDDDGMAQSLGSCAFMMRNTLGPLAARIKYQSAQLSVELAAFASGGEEREYTPCFTLENIELGVDKYFGISAHTGDVADNHDIFSFTVTDLSPAGVDLEAVRERYRLKIEEQHHLPKHEEMAQDEFQHTVLTILHQSQEALNLIEVSQIAIGDYLHSALGDGEQQSSPTPPATPATPAAPTPPTPPASGSAQPSVDAASLKKAVGDGNKDVLSKVTSTESLVKKMQQDSKNSQNSADKTMKDMQRTLNEMRSQMQRISSNSDPQEGGGESWLSFLMILVTMVVSCYHCFLTWNDQRRRFNKLP